MIKLAPSILSADFSKLGEEVKLIEQAGAHYVHIDVMDGHFVPNITLGPPIVKSLRKCTKLPFDVHLMISDPERYIDDFYQAGADILNIHAEACSHLHAAIQKIKGLGMQAAVTLNPATDLSCLEYVLEELSMVLIMSVNPGFGGQKLIPQTLRKIHRMADMIQKNNLAVDIEIDGGIGLENVQEAIEAGANVIVAGSAIYGAEDPPKTVKAFLDIFQRYEEKK